MHEDQPHCVSSASTGLPAHLRSCANQNFLTSPCLSPLMLKEGTPGTDELRHGPTRLWFECLFYNLANVCRGPLSILGLWPEWANTSSLAISAPQIIWEALVGRSHLPWLKIIRTARQLHKETLILCLGLVTGMEVSPQHTSATPPLLQKAVFILSFQGWLGPAVSESSDWLCSDLPPSVCLMTSLYAVLGLGPKSH